MRKSIFLGAGVFVVVLFLLGVLLGTPSNAKSIDVVNGVSPVSPAFNDIDKLLAELTPMDPSQRSEYITKKCPKLHEKVVYNLRLAQRLKPADNVDKVEFLFGSRDRVTAESGDGKSYEGFFKNQLLAKIYLKGNDKPFTVVVKCLNGLIEIPGGLKDIPVLAYGSPLQKFVIGSGKGLTSYVDYGFAITLAERFKLPVYKGKLMTEENRITYDEARALEGQTDKIAVTVYVVEGDEFNLIDMQFHKSPKRKTS